MLEPKLQVEQSPIDPNLLYVTDITPAYNETSARGGYGGPNISRSALSYVIFTLTTPHGKRFFSPTIMWTAGTYPLRVEDFAAFDTNPIVPEGTYYESPSFGGRFELQDGAYEIGYTLFGKTHIPSVVASYHIRLMRGTDQVWVSKNGVWTNITADGKLNADGYWDWAVFDTTDVYTYYQVRRYATLGGYEPCGGLEDIDKVISLTGPLTTSDSPKIVAGTTGLVLFTQRITRRLALLSKRLLTEIKPRPMAAGVSTATERLLDLLVARELLVTVQTTGRTTLPWAAGMLVDIDQRVKYLEQQESNFPNLHGR